MLLLRRIKYYHDLFWAEAFKGKEEKESPWITWFGTSIIMGFNIISIDLLLTYFSIKLTPFTFFTGLNLRSRVIAFMMFYGPFLCINYMTVMRNRRYKMIQKMEIRNKHLYFGFLSFTFIGFMSVLALICLFDN